MTASNISFDLNIGSTKRAKTECSDPAERTLQREGRLNSTQIFNGVVQNETGDFFKRK